MLRMNILILTAYMIERLLELFVSYRNKKELEQEMTVEVLDPKESMQMKFFHILWFGALFIESTVIGKMNDGLFLYFIVFVLVLAQILRWTCIFTLGKYWSVDVYRMDSHPIITEGPYAHIKHPNYLAVVTEFFFLPLLLGSFYTMFIGSILNILILKRRVAMEEKALLEQSLADRQNYRQKFKKKRGFIPLSH